MPKPNRFSIRLGHGWYVASTELVQGGSDHNLGIAVIRSFWGPAPTTIIRMPIPRPSLRRLTSVGFASARVVRSSCLRLSPVDARSIAVARCLLISSAPSIHPRRRFHREAAGLHLIQSKGRREAGHSSRTGSLQTLRALKKSKGRDNARPYASDYPACTLRPNALCPVEAPWVR